MISAQRLVDLITHHGEISITALVDLFMDDDRNRVQQQIRTALSRVPGIERTANGYRVVK